MRKVFQKVCSIINKNGILSIEIANPSWFSNPQTHLDNNSQIIRCLEFQDNLWEGAFVYVFPDTVYIHFLQLRILDADIITTVLNGTDKSFELRDSIQRFPTTVILNYIKK